MTLPRPLDLVGHWQIAAPQDAVWAALADPAQWPAWWPALRRAPAPAPLQAAQPLHLAWSAGGPFSGRLALQALQALPPERLRLRTGPVGGIHPAAGPAGECIWLLRADGGITQVTHVWRLDSHHGLARWRQQAGAPLLRWLHARVMRSGASGLARHLAANLGTGQGARPLG